MSKIKKETTQLEAYCINVVKVLCKTKDQITDCISSINEMLDCVKKLLEDKEKK